MTIASEPVSVTVPATPVCTVPLMVRLFAPVVSMVMSPLVEDSVMPSDSVKAAVELISMLPDPCAVSVLPMVMSLVVPEFRVIAPLLPVVVILLPVVMSPFVVEMVTSPPEEVTPAVPSPS